MLVPITRGSVAGDVYAILLSKSHITVLPIIAKRFTHIWKSIANVPALQRLGSQILLILIGGLEIP